MSICTSGSNATHLHSSIVDSGNSQSQGFCFLAQRLGCLRYFCCLRRYHGVVRNVKITASNCFDRQSAAQVIGRPVLCIVCINVEESWGKNIRDLNPSASVWPSSKQTPGLPCPYPSDRTPPDASMKQGAHPWHGPAPRISTRKNQMGRILRR